ncbi:TetR/AcrR family transcriptional regulator [Actinomadura macrotermitis]|uniref:HTH tetR-type domain-containing protein n=1 Tax=Actinomadura macrotermitis TaxID=2585200 RepID=A0A7K0C5V8_9ACTN|nr:hypothetical protein [Actinomadura macrotermitis]
MVVFAGQGDARRSLDLLWRPQDGGRRGGPGPRPGLSVEVIVATAIAVADAEGMAALSMRAVGERLGRTAMSLYTYVPGKSELVDLMYDRVLAELPAGYDTAAGWRTAATSWAEDTWAFLLSHPWVLQVSQARPVLGPNEYRMLDALLGVLRATGLPPRSVRPLVGTLLHFVRGSAQAVAEARQAAAVTGVSDEEWWQARSAVLQEVAPDFAGRFPSVAWLESEPPGEPGDPATYLEREARRAFESGLGVILDGIEAAAQGR